MILLCDNQEAISLANNPMHHAKTKHVDVRLHFIRDHIEKGTFNVEYCSMDNILADIMTKGLAHERHARLMGLIGIHNVTIAINTTPSSFENSRSMGQKS